MKLSSNLKTLKKNIKINIEPINFKPDENDLIKKWDEKFFILKEILKNGKANVCYQDIYQKINDLLLYEIPEKIKENFINILEEHSNEISKELIELENIIDINEFFENFNFHWNKILNNFLLLRKLFIKFEKKFFSSNISTQTIYYLCKQ
jgi:hypothetical protein